MLQNSLNSRLKSRVATANKLIVNSPLIRSRPCIGINLTVLQHPLIDTTYIHTIYNKIFNMFAWMGIDSGSFLYGLDHVQDVCNKINQIKL